MASTADTIFALATPPGKGGIAVVRVSGAHAALCLAAAGISTPPAPRHATRAALHNPQNGEKIDDALILWFPAPHSFTGENIAEFHIHGGHAVSQALFRLWDAIPHIRMAGPGEFTRRAFLNGKIGLTEAEGIADMIDAETEAQRRQALQQMDGTVGRFYDALRARIIRILAHIEAYLDFPDEEIPSNVVEVTRAEIKNAISDIRRQLDDEGRGEKTREGLLAVILGPPNAGKSSLLNLLARRDVAIVSPIAGTTRDAIEVRLDIGGYPVTLVDTAGLRKSDEFIEKEGIKRALAHAENADIKLWVYDITNPESSCIFQDFDDKNAIVIGNKSDLLSLEGAGASEKIAEKNNFREKNKRLPLKISTRTGQGIEDLLTIFENKITNIFSVESSPVITRDRHRNALTSAAQHLEHSLDSELPIEIACEELRLAARALGRVTGRVEVEEILDALFKNFCIGK